MSLRGQRGGSTPVVLQSEAVDRVVGRQDLFPLVERSIIRISVGCGDDADRFIIDKSGLTRRQVAQ